MCKYKILYIAEGRFVYNMLCDESIDQSDYYFRSLVAAEMRLSLLIANYNSVYQFVHPIAKEEFEIVEL